MTSQRKNGHDSVGTLYRVVLGEVAFPYDNVNLEQGMAYLQGKCVLFYIGMKTVVSSCRIIPLCHITLTNLLPSLSNDSIL